MAEFRLNTGHDFLAAHLHKFKILETDACYIVTTVSYALMETREGERIIYIWMQEKLFGLDSKCHYKKPTNLQKGKDNFDAAK